VTHNYQDTGLTTMSWFVGLMSGTSIDAIDAALVEFTADSVYLRATHYQPWPSLVRDELLMLSQQTRERSILHDIARLDILTAESFAQAVLTLLAQAHCPHTQVTAVGSPGQTVYHHPQGTPPYTWQLGDPNVIAQLTGIPVVADFRRRDVAAGGQGAPLTPAFHQAFWRNFQENRIVLNIGGIANITVLPAAKDLPVSGFDTGPGNALLDAWAYQQRQLPKDTGGQWAASGQMQPNLLEKLLTDPYFARPAPKSTGRDYFNLEWLNRYTQGMSLRPEDVQATLCQLTVVSIGQAVNKYQAERLLVCGGGAHNPLLMDGLARYLPACAVESTAMHGLDPDWVEAVSFAWLAKQRWEQQPSNLPSVTGARAAVVLGSVVF